MYIFPGKFLHHHIFHEKTHDVWSFLFAFLHNKVYEYAKNHIPTEKKTFLSSSMNAEKIHKKINKKSKLK